MQLQSNRTNKLKVILRSIIFLSLLVWCIGFSSQVLFPQSSLSAVSFPILKRVYGIVCHQRIAKTFFIKGHRLFVCARCTGIYFGALAISLLSLFFFKKISFGIKLLYVSIIPMLADVIFTTLRIYSYVKFIAFGTGLFFGSVVFIYILASIENNFLDQRINKNGS